MKRALRAVSVAAALTGAAVAAGVAHADSVTFAPDWPNHEDRAQQTICEALRQGWSRPEIVDAAERANDMDLTGLSVVEAAQRADALIDVAHRRYCPTVPLS